MKIGLKRVRGLLTKENRKSLGLFLVEGVRLVEEVLASPLTVECLFHVEADPDSRLFRVIEAAASDGIPTQSITQKELDAICDTRTPQGVVAVARTPTWTEEDVWKSGTGDVVVVDNVRDPGNLGTLLRSAEAAGARGVLLMPGTVELTNPKVVRGSMGAFFRLPVSYTHSIDDVLRGARSAGIPLVATSSHGGEPASLLLKWDAVALVLGGEAEGVARDWTVVCDCIVSLAQKRGTESLNVAVAGSIFLFRHLWRAV
ncbi:MAG TPA: RNA methyltransferase [Candidatus Latescibacteria bacterium]|nr:RNA methyltransferase [Candidatus Latescibacterota bacterium]